MKKTQYKNFLWPKFWVILQIMKHVKVLTYSAFSKRHLIGKSYEYDYMMVAHSRFEWRKYLRLETEQCKKTIITVLMFLLNFSYDLLFQEMLWWSPPVVRVRCRRYLNNSFWQKNTGSKHSKYSGFDQYVLVF